ncbi:H-NS histone family protein [Paraburkholderia sp. RL17-373-BIF-A]|uniref:H-NS histone family protein n=1 Tax=Paraburkholderia sp. RL17-373-BIF-A TaxID=3031629 RepID=UPI0038BD57DD
MDERKRDSMIAYLRHRMEDFGISPDDLAATLAAEPAAGRYRSAHGESWSGEGAMPQWLKQAISAGQSIGHFELASGAASAPSPHARAAAGAGAGWANDPFAGSPLARSNPR